MGLFSSNKYGVDVIELHNCEYCSVVIEGHAYPIELFDRDDGKFHPYRHLCSNCFEDLIKPYKYMVNSKQNG